MRFAVGTMANCTEQLLDLFQQSEKGNDKLQSLWEEFDGLSSTEKLVFCLKLPTGAQRDSNRDQYNKVKTELAQATAWIKTHLQVDKEQCIAKQEIFEDYLHFCKKQNARHIGREDFGKLMKNVYPSVTTRRLGMRGQTKHCYGGLAKRAEIEPPVLPEIGDLKQQNTEHQVVKSDGKAVESQIDKKDVVKACCAVIVEWAQKLLNEKFSTINDIAEHLVLKSYVNVSSEAAYTILSQVPKYREENHTSEPHGSRSTPQFCQQISSSGGRSARQQLQMKLQEKEKLKEQKRKLHEQRCAITGESPPSDEYNDSVDTATASYDASVSSETTTSNQDHVSRSVTVPKAILPKPVPLMIQSSVFATHPSQSSIGSRNSSFTCITSGQSPTTPQRPPSTPLLIVSPTPNSPSINQMLLASPLTVPVASATQASISIQQQKQLGSASTTGVTPQTVESPQECDNNNSGASFNKDVVYKTKPKEPETDIGAVLGGQTNCSNNRDAGAITSYTYVENSGQIEASDVSSGKEGLGTESSEHTVVGKSKGSQTVKQRSQSMSESIGNTPIKPVIRSTDSNQPTSQQREISETIDTQTIKQESEETPNENNSSQNIPHGVFLNFKLSDTESGGTNVAVPIGTLDPTAIAATGIHEDAAPESSSQLATNLISALNAKIVSMLQSPASGNNFVAPQRKASNSKTVSSLLKEQRVRVTSPECTGRNKYVNDNRPVAQILKEIREKKKHQNLSPKGATQNLSFTEEASPEEVKEHLTNQKMLREKIAKEAMVMRKAHVPSSAISRPRRKSRRDVIKEKDIAVSAESITASTKKETTLRNDSVQDASNTPNPNQMTDVSSPQNIEGKRLTDDYISGNINRNGKGSVVSQDNMSSDADINASIGRKETAVLKLLLEEALGKETFNKVLVGKSVAASTNPKLASLLSSNNDKKVVSTEKQQAADLQKKFIAQLLQRLSNSTDKNSQLDSTITPPQSDMSKMIDCNMSWDQNPNMHYRQILTYSAADNNGGNVDYEGTASTNEILDLVSTRSMENETVHNRSASCMDMNSAFMPIQSVSEGNTVSPVKPQVKTVDSNSILSSRGTQMNAKLKALLSQESSRQNSPTDNVEDIYNTSDWVSRQSSNFVPYNQNCNNLPEDNLPLNMNMSNPGLQPIHTSIESNTFQESNTNNQFILNNAALDSGSNNNGGFASMVGVKPPMKRTMDSDRTFSNKRCRHLSDQSHIRPRRSEFATPIQPLLPPEQTMSQESLAMASPSSHGYGHCPPESPFSPEVHDIMSNPSDVFSGDFNSTMGNNNLRSVSVPAHNFMQGDIELGTYLTQDGGILSDMQCPPQNYSGQPQQPSQQGSYSYHQPPDNGISSAYRSDNNNSATYNNVKKNLLQILESRLASEGFRNAANQNLRGDHMISGASVKLPHNMRHKISETLNSVMIQNMNHNAQYTGHGLMQGQMNQLQVPNPTPPESHPPTPVEFCNDGSEKYDGNHGYQMNQQVGMGCNMIPTTVDGTPTSLENVSSQSSRESLADPLFNMCEEGSSGVEMQGNNQFDFLRIL